ncbi:Vacuolar protein sorting-associated protein 37B [Amphibalanus amphitrite]|uniref:Vacuolar protein sorting-associated protein 37B n=3 Tax=Amphibalanus amphitrite TaxID=1232801 RepID=A0A6A4WST4_AMPAM|nr:vacuolar protein sorting-associated protein 37B-like isoform X2 [Amphibalanus amphitrite]XP_043197309.1 vacuolar protein sorting-associated protein 37B-like isoform X2 [Amphibalanus amphitrite]XP_043197310.1 vacuolar protein sorting-associated protein 37B-like isoform X2 [Amphibalanus amphitrite]XP_043244511.1 vacuolar protein sorting-associated protein 37B-like isoform X1 [Amphibalanus amphitrite]XP_043244512.1 vacuolar protein sorting-associated protein 37B-like isoform X1 [Amphibalanus am
MYSAPSEVESAIQSVLSSLNLHSLSTDELKQLLNEDDKLNDKINDAGAIQALRNKRDFAVAGNKSLAEYNLSRQPRIMELKSLVRQQLEEAESQEQQIREKRDNLNVVDQPLDTTLALLQTAAAQAEEESENLVQSMLRGEMSIDNFLELYLPKRQTAIARRVKVDKLKELLPSAASSGGGGGASGRYRPPPSSVPYPPSSVPTPYPASPAAPYGGGVPYPASSAPGPYPAGPAYMPAPPAMPYPYVPGGMPLPRY